MLAAKPDCVVYTAMADIRLPEALEDYRRILSAGVDMVGRGPVFLQYPWQVLPEEADRSTICRCCCSPVC